MSLDVMCVMSILGENLASINALQLNFILLVQFKHILLTGVLKFHRMLSLDYNGFCLMV